MKATGIVRRIDDLGRIVIPKEIRRTMRINEGTPLEIFTDTDNSVTLKKYSPVMEIRTIAEEYASGLAEVLNCTVCISDSDTMVAVHHGSRKDYFDKGITTALAKLIWDKKPIMLTAGQTKNNIIPLIDGEPTPLEYSWQCLCPIVAQGDPIGCVVAFSKVQGAQEESAICAVKLTAGLMAKHIMM